MKYDGIISKIKPTKDDRAIEERVIKRVFEVLSNYEVEPVLVGSLAKDTDLKDNKDIDVFIQFKPEVERKKLETEGLRIGKEVFKRLGVEFEIDYAEHPYVKGVFEGFSIEIVPCYSGAEILSAVDRSTLHTEYVKKKLSKNKINDEIRLLKLFMMGVGVYGAEAKVEGFSGYLVELLTIYYGSFEGVLKSARGWNIPVILDIENLWDRPESIVKFFTKADIVVVDPVDRTRNVAAAVSTECLSKFMVKSAEFLGKQSIDFFFPPEKPVKSVEELEGIMKSRGTKFFALVFKHEKINENTLYAQLRKTSKQLVRDLEDMEFTVFKHGFHTNEKDTSAIILEFEVHELPELVHHIGPPTNLDAVHQERFTTKYANEKPYIKDGRWVVDTKRKHTNARTALDELVNKKDGFGKNFREWNKPEVVEGKEIMTVECEGLLKYINEHVD
ncbi:MAG: CCA tRNA nucleotidyltransferase [Candidatus Altiarchaeota archaeon]|nr:CCA tRNA nucleotidyltransferase [Candidatus Altiarchaeota archaeon]